MTQRATSWSERLYGGLLLWLYPAAFRRQFGEDMRELFRDRWREERRRGGRRGIARLWLRMIPDLAMSATREHASNLRTRIASRVVPQSPRHCNPTPGDSMLETFMSDLRYSLRMMAKSPTFTIVAVVVIALGSGAVTTIFSAANAAVLRPLPAVTRPQELVDVARTRANSSGSSTPSYPFFIHVRDESRTLSGIAAVAMVSLTISSGAEGTGAFGNMVSGNYFDVLGVRPALGRFFAASEDVIGVAHPVVVLSHGYWQRRFGADSGVIGRSIVANGSPFTVIGVAPPRFSGVFPLIRTDVWAPLTMEAQLGRGPGLLTNPNSGWLVLFGRLKPETSIAQARAELTSIAAAHMAEEADESGALTGISMSRLTGFPADANRAVFGFVALLLIASALVLVIASVNVAGMLLARAVSRRREMAVRIALGAGRARLVRQMLTESTLLFIAGGGGGLLIAFWGARVFERVQLPAEVPVVLDLSPDYRVLAFTLATALLTGVIFGLAPALQATRNDPSVSLRSDTPGSGKHRSRIRNGLVVGQMALSLLLLMSAGLFLRALARGEHVSPGFEIDHVATAPIDVGTSGYADDRARLFYDALKARLLATPGVTAVSFGRWVPLTMSSAAWSVKIDGYDPPPGRSRLGLTDVNIGVVAADYFTVLKMPLLRGRAMVSSDDAGAPHIVVVNEAFGRKFWPGADPIGRTLRDGPTVITVVGVVRDAKYSSLNEELRPFMYLPLAQNWKSATNVFVRTTGDATSLARVIHDAVRALDPLLPAPEALTLNAATSVVLLPQRVAAAVTGVMGILGLILAAVGLYGVVAYTVSQRTREIGVRMALGADRANVLAMILRDGMRLVAAGMGVGMLLALGATRVLTQFLFGVSPLDPLVFAVIPLALAAVALLATYIPARRAAATNPLAAIRQE